MIVISFDLKFIVHFFVESPAIYLPSTFFKMELNTILITNMIYYKSRSNASAFLCLILCHITLNKNNSSY